MTSRRSVPARVAQAERELLVAAVCAPAHLQREILFDVPPEQLRVEEHRVAWKGMRDTFEELGVVHHGHAYARGLLPGELLDNFDRYAADYMFARGRLRAAHGEADAEEVLREALRKCPSASLDGPLSTLLEDTARELQRIASKASPEKPDTTAELVDRTIEEVQAEEEDDGISTGVIELDDRIGGGLRPGSVTAILGRSGHGKSSFALSIVALAVQGGRRGLYVTREMLRREMHLRLAAWVLGMPMNQVRYYLRTDESFVEEVRSGIRHLPIHFEDQERDIGAIAARVCTAKERDRSFELVVLDFLQVLDGPGANQFEVLENIAYGAKDMALRSGCAVLALVQPNREGSRRDGYLEMADIRGSSGIENACDTILSILRHEPALEGSDYPFDIKVIKARSGGTGELKQSCTLGAGTFRVQGQEPSVTGCMSEVDRTRANGEQV